MSTYVSLFAGAGFVQEGCLPPPSTRGKKYEKKV